MKQKWIAAAVLLLLSLASGRAQSYTEIVAFGDSMTDMGNRGIATNNNSAVYPYQTWVKQLAGPTRLNITPFGPSGTTAWGGAGATNYAHGGATTKYTADQGLGDATGRNLTNQVSSRYLNPAWNTGGVRTAALHTVFIGCNDINFAARANPASVLAGPSYLNNHARQAALSAEGQIQALAAAGATEVLWLNLPDMAKIPVVSENAEGNPIILSRFTSASQAFNSEMDDAIGRLQSAHPSLHLMKFDMYAAFNAIIANPSTYGFTNVTGGSANDNYLFTFDKLHPTSHGHFVIAELVYDYLGEIEPEPPVESEAIAYDGFNYAATANVSAAADSATDVGWSGTTWSGSNDVIAPGLSYSGFPSEGNALQFTSGVASSRTIDPAAMPADISVIDTDGVKRLGVTGSTLWFAFLVRADAADADGTKTASLNLMGATTGGSTKIGIGDTGSHANWAVAKGSTTAASGTAITVGQTVLLVTRIKFIAGSNNDEVDLFVNPSPGAEPTTPSAMLRGVDIGKFHRVEFKGNRQSTADELAIGRTWSDVMGQSAPASVLYEAESIATVSATDMVQVFSEAAASGGAGEKLHSNAVNDYIAYTIPVAQPGTYAIKVRVKKLSSRGICQLSIDGVNQGAVQDQYAPAISYEVLDLGTKTFTTAGNKVFKFTVTGKNASSSNYDLAFDYIQLGN